MASSVRSAFSSDSCLKAADLKKAEAIEGLKLNTDGCGDKLRSCGCWKLRVSCLWLRM